MIVLCILILIFIAVKVQDNSSKFNTLTNESKRAQNHVIQNVVEAPKQYSTRPDCNDGHTFGRWNVAGVSDVRSSLRNGHWEYEVSISSIRTCSICAHVNEKIKDIERISDYSFDEELFRNQALKMAELIQDEFDRAASAQLVIEIE